ncbi:hypothetical protein Pla22_31380 [Rubripirellula amarantea]|uniref:Uncharacterized protein n=1 Tax=Rubripirellula amarantea TaxID=2527999 RepID=A0A5C5WHW9_9BACT|nr:hypothetical protein [Rubripirellula amarantea]TWT50396.1 hypothetical protein Pla22_31380 [Rubripirellula amarantea]
MILTSPQRRALVAIDTFLASGETRANFRAERGCGLTALLQYLVDINGMGAVPTDFVIAQNSPIEVSANSVCRTVWLVDRATDCSEAAMQHGTVISAVRPQSRCVIDLQPMTCDELADFLRRQQATLNGRMVTYTDTAVRELHRQTAGRVALLMPQMARVLQTLSHLGESQVDTALVTACQGEARRAA